MDDRVGRQVKAGREQSWTKRLVSSKWDRDKEGVGTESTAADGVGWKTAKICITIADRNNYARNARERDGGIRTRMQMQTVRWWWNRRVCGGEGKAASTTETRLEMQIREYAGGSSRQRKKKKRERSWLWREKRGKNWNEKGWGVEETEWIWRRREKGPVSLLCLHGASERKSGKERDSKRAAGSRHRLRPLDAPVSRNCWINNCRTEQKNRKHGNSVIYCASSVRYCENSETFVCEGEKM